mmetsp:Transcript_19390/g.53309  ORF Transcript_19390/g.53309 Transcript_19390/m.53309 type:complete len:325 (-) Transcript_19390:39-1013(-)
MVLLQVGSNQSPSPVVFHRQVLSIDTVAVVSFARRPMLDTKTRQRLDADKVGTDNAMVVLKGDPVIQIPIVKGVGIIVSLKNIHVRSVHHIVRQDPRITIFTDRAHDANVGRLIGLQRLDGRRDPALAEKLGIIIDSNKVFGIVRRPIGQVSNFVKGNVPGTFLGKHGKGHGEPRGYHFLKGVAVLLPPRIIVIQCHEYMNLPLFSFCSGHRVDETVHRIFPQGRSFWRLNFEHGPRAGNNGHGGFVGRIGGVVVQGNDLNRSIGRRRRHDRIIILWRGIPKGLPRRKRLLFDRQLISPPRPHVFSVSGNAPIFGSMRTRSPFQ